MTCPLTPYDDRVVVTLIEQEGQTKGGIVLPDQAKGKPKRGVVLAVGPGRLMEHAAPGTRAPMVTQVGDVVYFSEFEGTDITVDEVEFRVLAERDILARGRV